MALLAALACHNDSLRSLRCSPGAVFALGKAPSVNADGGSGQSARCESIAQLDEFVEASVWQDPLG